MMSSLPSTTGPVGRGPERRRHVRCRVLEKQLVTVDLGPEHRGLLVDVSLGGAAVQPYAPLHAGESSQVKFCVPGLSQVVKAEGVVTWVGPSGRAGIQFTHIEEAGEHSLKDWVEGMSAPTANAAPNVVYSTAAYLPPSYSPWIKIGYNHVSPSPMADEISFLDLVSALRLVVERARSLTRGTGAAIALADGGDMVCRARTGIAPDLGARFRPDSGLSGEAVRTSTVALCRDTEQDERVDQSACQRLNVRSIVIMPILSGGAVIGVIEVFSARCDAFEDRDVVNLRRLAELVAAMLENAGDMASQVPIEAHIDAATRAIPAFEEFQAPTTALAEPDGEKLAAEAPVDRMSDTGVPPQSHSETDSTTQADQVLSAASAPVQEEAAGEPKPIEEINKIYSRFMNEVADEDRRRRNKTILSVILALALAGGAFGVYQSTSRSHSTRTPISPSAQMQLPQNAALTSSDPVIMEPEFVPAPTPAQQAAASVPQPLTKPATKPVTKREPEVIAENWVWTAPAKAGLSSEMKLQSVEPMPEAPPVNLGTDDPKQLAELLTASPSSRPELAAAARPVHVQEGRLITRITPTIPAMASASGMHGSVVVKIVIGKSGRVDKAQLVDGNTILGGAAVAALSKWRYQPFTLNGQPITVEKLVTINFADPRK